VRPFYRAKQFFRAFGRPSTADPKAVAAVHLSMTEQALFGHMSPYDQRHALAVLERLEQQECVEPELMRAALLHDAGKAAIRTRLWHRVVHVLLQAIARNSDAVGAYAWHAEVGARLAEQAGSTPTVVALIREHHRDTRGGRADDTFEAMLKSLQEADETA
jgi:HD superfamily phosphodiesterase